MDHTEESIFAEALEKPPKERAAYLDRACAGQPELRRSVESLLDAYQGGSYLEPIGDLLNETALSDDETGQHVGPYKLLEKIGEGGMGAVYMAEQRRPIKRRVALKIIKLGMDTKQVVARFEAERQALAMMDHPNIARVLDAGMVGSPSRAGLAGPAQSVGPAMAAEPVIARNERPARLAGPAGRPYFVMELVRGIRITKYCDQNRLSTGERLELFVQICQAIQHAHQKGIIHRDIKPSNILVTLHDGVPVPKVIDFGIAKATQAELTEKTLVTQFHQMIGTPAYMSPEQAEMSGLDIDTRSDIYSLGVLLYELLTGKTPLDGKKLLRGGYDEMRRRIKEEEPPTPSTRARTLQGEERTAVAKHRKVDPSRLGSELRGDLDWIVMKALEKDRTRRYETANALAMDVKRHLTNEPVLARPPSAAYRFHKLLRRNKLTFAATGAVALALVLGIVGSTSQAIRASHAEREQVTLRQNAEAEADRANRESERAHYAARQMRRHSYAADMKAVDVAIRENNLGYARSLLARYLPAPRGEDLRGVEWRYLWQACRSDALKKFDHDTIVNQAAFSRNGRLAATTSFDGKVRIWDVSFAKPIKQFAGYDGEDPNHPLAFSPDGRFLACGHAGGVTIRDTSDWTIAHHEEGCRLPVRFSPDGKLLAMEAECGVQLCDTATWRSTFLDTGFARTFISRLAFSADSRLLAVSGGNGRSIQVWEVHSRRRVAEFAFSPVCSIAFFPSPAGVPPRWLVAGCNNGNLEVCDLETKEVATTYPIHANWLLGLAFSPDGETLATGGGDQVIYLWRWRVKPDGPPELERLRALKGHGNEVWSLEYSPDGRFLISSGKDRTARIWSTKTERQPTVSWDAGSDVRLLGFSVDGATLYTISAEQREISSWNVATLKLVRKFDLPSEAALRTPSTGPAVRLFHGDTVLFGTTKGMVQTWDLRTGHATRTVRAGNGAVFPLGMSPDERLVFVWDPEERLASLWNFQTRSREAVFGAYRGGSFRGGHYSGYVAFSPDGRYLAYPASNYQVKLWDIAQGRDRFPLKGHKWVLFRPQFSPDGKLLVTSSWDGDIRLWDVATGMQSVPTLSGHLSGPSSTVFSSDGRTLLTSGSNDDMVQFWNVATGKQMVTLRNAEEGMLSSDGKTLIWRQSGTYRMLRLPSLAEIDASADAEQL